jgi:putative component of membrane protein insertase Oxa1/YidC/SpoIIIJ protein YidD
VSLGSTPILAPMLLAVAGAAVPARAEPPLRLSDARGAIEFLLESPDSKIESGRPAPDLTQAAPGDEWDGSLGSGIARSLFWGYRFFFSSQDSDPCGFSPSCSRFSQQVIEQDGFFEGLLATFDRLSRDNPFSAAFYPVDLETHLLLDPPEQYCLGCHR